MIETVGRYGTAKIFTDEIEETAYKQIIEILNQKSFYGSNIRVMPDVHAGKGSVIGFTARLGSSIIPNIVGVDIGCGMEVTKLGFVDINLPALDAFIRKNIPSGHGVHNGARTAENKLRSILGKETPNFLSKVQEIADRTGTSTDRHIQSLGSLGGGNHFIEVNKDSNGELYLVIHSGSRNLGLQVAKYHQKKAENYCGSLMKNLENEKNAIVGKLRQAGRESEIAGVIEHYKELKEEYRVPKDLTFLPEGDGMEDYLYDMEIAQQFALLSRQIMSKDIVEYLGLNYSSLEKFTSVHNYIDFKDRIIRKGSTPARLGEKLIIPINMRDGSIIGTGKGNDDWNQSAPHGAGRVLSRSAAKAKLSLDEFKDTMEGIWTSSVDSSTLDESPMAYKKIESILDNIGDSVEVTDIIKPIYNFKANE